MSSKNPSPDIQSLNQFWLGFFLNSCPNIDMSYKQSNMVISSSLSRQILYTVMKTHNNQCIQCYVASLKSLDDSYTLVKSPYNPWIH